jgi:hypothetical protein
VRQRTGSQPLAADNRPNGKASALETSPALTTTMETAMRIPDNFLPVYRLSIVLGGAMLFAGSLAFWTSVIH